MDVLVGPSTVEVSLLHAGTVVGAGDKETKTHAYWGGLMIQHPQAPWNLLSPRVRAHRAVLPFGRNRCRNS